MEDSRETSMNEGQSTPTLGNNMHSNTNGLCRDLFIIFRVYFGWGNGFNEFYKNSNTGRKEHRPTTEIAQDQEADLIIKLFELKWFWEKFYINYLSLFF